MAPPSQNDKTTSSTEPRTSRRTFLAGAATTLTIGSGVATTSKSARAAGDRPTVPNDFDSEDSWSNPKNLAGGDREGVIEWAGTKLENTALQQAIGKEHEELRGVPLWNLYAWRINQNEIPQQTKEEGGSNLLGPFSITAYLGPIGVTADLEKVGKKVRKAFTDKKGYITETAADVFASQIESDYPFVESVTICNGLEKGGVGCYGNKMSYSNPAADIRSRLTFEATHTVAVDWGRNYEISYRSFLVIQTYDTDAISDLNKTFIATAAVFPEEVSRVGFDQVNTINNYDFIKRSREFMKGVNPPSAE